MSKSAVMVKCWKCEKAFSSNRERKAHMSSKEHECLSVMCPYCPKRQTFKRSNPELKDHVKSRHGYEWAVLTVKEMLKTFFTEGNGYWMAVYPRDYRHLVKPSDYDSPAAKKARETIRVWLEKNGGPERSKALAEWESGWRLQREATRLPSIEPESSFVPDYEETVPTPKRQRTEEYSPETPSINIPKLGVQDIDIREDGEIEGLLFTEGDSPIWYKAAISQEVYEDKKSVASVMRRAATVQNLGILPPNHMIELSLKAPVSSHTRSLMCAIADTLGLSKRYIKRLQCGTSFEQTAPSS